MINVSNVRLSFTLLILVLTAYGNTVLASHTLNPACGNLILNPTGLGGSTETYDACLIAALYSIVYIFGTAKAFYPKYPTTTLFCVQICT